jgi:hypothetical protein
MDKMTKDKELLINLSEILTKKLRLLQNIQSITEEQKKIIVDEDIDKLNKLIQKKQKIINLIDNIDIKFNDMFLELKRINNIENLNDLESPDIGTIKELKSKISNIKKITNDIILSEKENNSNAKMLLSNLSIKIKKIKSAKKTNSAYNYGNSIKQPSYFIDKKK